MIIKKYIGTYQYSKILDANIHIKDEESLFPHYKSMGLGFIFAKEKEVEQVKDKKKK